MGRQVVWFKRDLRVFDHAPLAAAARRGPVLGLYVFEPSLLEKVTTDPSHVVFVRESLAELKRALEARGGRLLVARGELPEVLDRLFEVLRFEALWSHEETGDLATYARDRRVKRWCRDRGLSWTELPQNGVVRGAYDRDGWSRLWLERARAPLVRPPESLAAPDLDPWLGSEPSASNAVWFGVKALPSLEELRVPASTKAQAQPGGEPAARRTLDTFLSERGRTYRSDLSSPVTSGQACSRLSPHIAYGNISIRHVYQAARRRLHDLRGRPTRSAQTSGWVDSLKSFESRLRWHCHFMQKLKDEPEIEVRNMNRAFDGLRTEDPDEWSREERDRFDAWCEGRTGYPMVDAVMRALHRGGWINFRMRAMLVSFAAHHLWLHWLPLARYLARHFLDYEPGIHFSQFQMQSGTTGINTTRIYNPTKQVRDQDPDGAFIRAHVPELARVPTEYIAEPQRMPTATQVQAGCRIGRDYPSPIVDHMRAYRRAHELLHARKRTDGARRAGREVLRRHGSRRRSG